MRRELRMLVVALAVSAIAFAGVYQPATAHADEDARQLEVDTEREAASVAEWYDNRIRWVDERSVVLTGLGVGDSEQTQTSLQQNANRTPPDVRELLQIDLSTTEVHAASRDSRLGAVLAETSPWAQDDLPAKLNGTDDVLVSEVYERDGEHVMAFVTPIPQAGDAGLVAIVNPQRFATRAPPGPDRFTTVVDTDTAQVVMANRVEDDDQTGGELVGQQYTDQDTVTGLGALSGPTHLEEAPNQDKLDEKYLAAVAPVEGTNLVVLIHEREAADEENSGGGDGSGPGLTILTAALAVAVVVGWRVRDN